MFGGGLCGSDPCGKGDPCSQSQIRVAAIVSSPAEYSPLFTSTIFNDALKYITTINMALIPFGQAAFYHCSTTGVVTLIGTSSTNLSTFMTAVGFSSESDWVSVSGAGYGVCSGGSYAFCCFRCSNNTNFYRCSVLLYR